jgi:hypothetical protein
MTLFAGYIGQHGTHGVPELDPNGFKWSIKKTARTIKQPVTEELWQQHLNGKRPLGIVPICADSTCVWGSIDIDQYDMDTTAVVKKVEAMNLPLVPCRSKSGGLHLFMFFAQPVEAASAQNLLRDIAASLGFAGSEIFPKQTKILVEHGDQGNWIVMPYFGSTYDGKLKAQHGIKHTGAEMTVGEFLTMAEKRRVTTEQMIDLLQRSTPQEKPSKDGKKKERPPFSDGPPCLQHLAQTGFPDGGRNNALFHLGVYWKKAKPTDWQKHVEEDNQRFMKPPLPAEEVVSVIKQLQKKDYEYKCKDEPMKQYCESGKCRMRQYGVGGGDTYPQILGIARLKTEPPLWFVQIPNARIPMRTPELQNYKRFHQLCMDHTKVCHRMISDKEWFAILQEPMLQAEDIEAPYELGAPGIFLELLETFLTNRMRGKKKEDLLRGAPWEDEEAGRHYFSMAALEKFLQREGIRNIERSMLKYRINELKGGNESREIKGKQRGLWWVPSSAIQVAPELDTPETPKELL